MPKKQESSGTSFIEGPQKQKPRTPTLFLEAAGTPFFTTSNSHGASLARVPSERSSSKSRAGHCSQAKTLPSSHWSPPSPTNADGHAMCHGGCVADHTLRTLTMKRTGSAPGELNVLLGESRRNNQIFAGNTYKGSGGRMIGM
eukprot:CAMPEP_0117542276 /NCGR_PEP_ID=MMETSP0784-20121206/44461_1 /TAXON_ID=39447 /ORGANISM="" /LENGTH=142 /DNA_ID=CAMNT_0005339017 /DNA_START=48 /DNA_END=476 /DNA_ORIENTATION=-